MKRIGVAGIIIRYGNEILLGRRGKDPNRGLYVFPGGGVEDNETYLEQTFVREIMEETGFQVAYVPDRWTKPAYVLDLPDRLILFAKATVHNHNDAPQAGSDLYDVGWFSLSQLPEDLSPTVRPVWSSLLKEREGDPYSDKNPSAW